MGHPQPDVKADAERAAPPRGNHEAQLILPQTEVKASSRKGSPEHRHLEI